MMLSGKMSAPAPAGVRAPQRSGFSGTVAPLRAAKRCNRRAVAKAAQANAAADAMGDPLPSPEKRTIMNLLLVGAAGLTTAGLAAPYLYFFFPTKPAGQGDLLAAKDALGAEVKASKWIKEHKPEDRALTQGLKSDATYLIVTPELQIETFGLNAVCTHLGCVVPWSQTDNKFKCPCHGSQYNNQGKVVRGPAPLSLALAHTQIKDDIVYFSEWKEKDFRTGLDPWWA